MNSRHNYYYAYTCEDSSYKNYVYNSEILGATREFVRIKKNVVFGSASIINNLQPIRDSDVEALLL